MKICIEFSYFSDANFAKKAQMAKGKGIFLIGFSLFFFDLSQKNRFPVAFFLFFLYLVIGMFYLCNITNRNRLWIIV